MDWVQKVSPKQAVDEKELPIIILCNNFHNSSGVLWPEGDRFEIPDLSSRVLDGVGMDGVGSGSFRHDLCQLSLEISCNSKTAVIIERAKTALPLAAAA